MADLDQLCDAIHKAIAPRMPFAPDFAGQFSHVAARAVAELLERAPLPADIACLSALLGGLRVLGGLFHPQAEQARALDRLLTWARQLSEREQLQLRQQELVLLDRRSPEQEAELAAVDARLLELLPPADRQTWATVRGMAIRLASQSIPADARERIRTGLANDAALRADPSDEHALAHLIAHERANLQDWSAALDRVAELEKKWAAITQGGHGVAAVLRAEAGPWISAAAIAEHRAVEPCRSCGDAPLGEQERCRACGRQGPCGPGPAYGVRR